MRTENACQQKEISGQQRDSKSCFSEIKRVVPESKDGEKSINSKQISVSFDLTLSPITSVDDVGTGKSIDKEVRTTAQENGDSVKEILALDSVNPKITSGLVVRTQALNDSSFGIKELENPSSNCKAVKEKAGQLESEKMNAENPPTEQVVPVIEEHSDSIQAMHKAVKRSVKAKHSLFPVFAKTDFKIDTENRSETATKGSKEGKDDGSTTTFLSETFVSSNGTTESNAKQKEVLYSLSSDGSDGKRKSFDGRDPPKQATNSGMFNSVDILY